MHVEDERWKQMCVYMRGRDAVNFATINTNIKASEYILSLKCGKLNVKQA